MSPMSEQAIRVGFVGAGANTRLHHIPKLRAQPGVVLMGVANRSVESGERVAKEIGIKRVYGDWRELCRRRTSTPSASAPGPRPSRDLRGLAGRRQARALRGADGHERGRGPQHAGGVAEGAAPRRPARAGAPTLEVDSTITRLLAEGYVGEVLTVELQAAQGRFVDAEAPLHWRQDIAVSGHNVLNMGIWYEAMMRWLGPARRVMAMTRSPSRAAATRRAQMQDVKVPDHVDILITYVNGAVGHLRFSSITALAPASEAWIFGTRAPCASRPTPAGSTADGAVTRRWPRSRSRPSSGSAGASRRSSSTRSVAARRSRTRTSRTASATWSSPTPSRRAPRPARPSTSSRSEAGPAVTTPPDLAAHWPLDPAIASSTTARTAPAPRGAQAAGRAARRLEAEPVRFFVRELEALDDGRAALGASSARIPTIWRSSPTPPAGVNAVLRSLGSPRATSCSSPITPTAPAGTRSTGSPRRTGARVVVARVPFPLRGPRRSRRPCWPRSRRGRGWRCSTTSPARPRLVLPIERMVAGAGRARRRDAGGWRARARAWCRWTSRALGAAYYSRQLPQVAVRAQGRGFPLRAARSPGGACTRSPSAMARPASGRIGRGSGWSSTGPGPRPDRAGSACPRRSGRWAAWFPAAGPR